VREVGDGALGVESKGPPGGLLRPGGVAVLGQGHREQGGQVGVLGLDGEPAARRVGRLRPLLGVDVRPGQQFPRRRVLGVERQARPRGGDGLVRMPRPEVRVPAHVVREPVVRGEPYGLPGCADRLCRPALPRQRHGQEGVPVDVLRLPGEQFAQFPLGLRRAVEPQQRPRPIERDRGGHHLALPRLPSIQGINSSQAPESLACRT
jgi:hypothetical protein